MLSYLGYLFRGQARGALEAVISRPEGIDLSHLEQLAFNAELADPDVVARVRDVCGYLFRGQARGARDDPPLSARTLLDR